MRRFAGSMLSPTGDTGRVEGADFAFILPACPTLGSGVVHISQTRKDGWLRKVHAGHAIPSGSSFIDGGDRSPGELEEDKEVYEDSGREEDKDWIWDDASDAVDPADALRGTPHRAHIRAAAGLKPGGLRWLHTSHSQLSNISVRCPDVAVKGKAVSASRKSETFAEDLNKPAK
jgi:hypothetical protein